MSRMGYSLSGGRYAFRGTMISKGPDFEAYVGDLGRRVPFVQYARNAITYWPLRSRPAPQATGRGTRRQ